MLAAMLVLAGVSAGVLSATASGSQAIGGTVVARGTIDWRTFDIQENNYNPSITPVMAAYERLVAFGPKLDIIPWLATKWKVGPKTATFTLRKDATCSDGTKVTTKVVHDSFKRLIEVPKIFTQMLGYFGPGPYGVSHDPAKGTFTFRVGTPFRNLLGSFARGLTSVICPALVNHTDQNAIETQMLGSGPYTLVSAVHNDQIVFKLRPEYKTGPMGTTAKVLPDMIIYKPIPNVTTTANQLLTGEVNITAQDISGPDLARLDSNKSIIHKQSQNYHVFTLSFNMNPGRITTDKSVRAALATVVDPKEWLQAAFAGSGKLSPGLLAPGATCHSNESQKYMPKPSLDRARQHLREGGWTQQGSGWVKGGQPLKLKLLTGGANTNNGGQYLFSKFKELGVDVDPFVDDTTTYGRDITLSNFDVTVHSFNSVTPDPGQELGSYTGPPVSKQGGNLGAYGLGDPKYDRYARLAMATTGKESCRYFRLFEQNFLTNFYHLPLAAPLYHMYSNGIWNFSGPPVHFSWWSIRKIQK